MIYRLIIMRHAKSDWDSGAATDHERPLNQRGRRDAPRVAAELVRLGWQPDLVISSDACRTTETLERMQDQFEPSPSVRFTPRFYHAGVREVEQQLGELTDDVRTVMVLGHNPGWQSSVFVFSGETASMTTANAALLSIECDSWNQAALRKGAWKLHDVIRPKELEDHPSRN